MVTPIIDPVVEPSVTPAFYPVPPILASWQIIERLVSGSVVSSQTGEPVAVAPPSMSDLSLGPL